MRPEWNGQMDLTTRFTSVERWLRVCSSQRYGSHKSCFSITTPGYPSRLLSIVGFEKSGWVHLVDTETWSSPRPDYTTLSHVWGPPEGPRPLITTTETLEAHKTAIRMTDLPLTFRDAVKITNRIGIKFLWIDSLCIIQDDAQDWQHEAANMAAIYENSFFTIAAAASENCEGGCGLDPWTPTLIRARARTSPAKYRGGLRPETSYQLKIKRVEEVSSKPPLQTRGWALQEVVLSRRTVS